MLVLLVPTVRFSSTESLLHHFVHSVLQLALHASMQLIVLLVRRLLLWLLTICAIPIATRLISSHTTALAGAHAQEEPI